MLYEVDSKVRSVGIIESTADSIKCPLQKREISEGRARIEGKSQREQDLLNWQEFLTQMDIRARVQKANLESRNSTSSQSIAVVERSSRGKENLHQYYNRKHSNTRVLNRTTIHTLDHASNSTRESLWTSKKRNSNIKNLSVAIPAQFPLTPGYPTPATRQRNMNRQGDKLERPARTSQADFGDSHQIKKSQERGLKTRPTDYTKVNEESLTKTCNEESESASRKSRYSNVLASAAMRGTVESDRGSDGESKDATTSVGALPLTQPPIVMNLHLPRAPYTDPVAEQLARENLQAFKQMLTMFVKDQKEFEAQLLQHIIKKSDGPSQSTLQRSISVMSRSRHAKVSKKQASCSSAMLSMPTLASEVRKPSNCPQVLPLAETLAHSVSSGQKHNELLPSPLDSFQFMKDTIARISQHESYSRSYNAARNFSSNAKTMQRARKSSSAQPPSECAQGFSSQAPSAAQVIFPQSTTRHAYDAQAENSQHMRNDSTHTTRSGSNSVSTIAHGYGYF